MLEFISGKKIADIKEVEHKMCVQKLQEKGLAPKLAIIQTISSPVIDTYVRVKKAYAEKIGIHVDHYNVSKEEVGQLVGKLNSDDLVRGIIIQLPLHEGLDQETTLNLVAKSKDVDGLALDSTFVPPTVQSILWLLSAYVDDVGSKKIALVGKGRLVGAPLERELIKQGIVPQVFTKQDSLETLSEYNVIISATGTPSLLANNHIQPGSYVFDAGTAEENGTIHGDTHDELYTRGDISITPQKGGIGILTVRALFENVLRAAEKQ